MQSSQFNYDYFNYLLVLRLRFELHVIKITEQQFDRGKNDISSCDILSKSCFSYLYTCTSLIMKKYVNLKYMFTCNLNIARLHYMEISVRSTFQIAGRRSLT